MATLGMGYSLSDLQGNSVLRPSRSAEEIYGRDGRLVRRADCGLPRLVAQPVAQEVVPPELLWNRQRQKQSGGAMAGVWICAHRDVAEQNERIAQPARAGFLVKDRSSLAVPFARGAATAAHISRDLKSSSAWDSEPRSDRSPSRARSGRGRKLSRRPASIDESARFRRAPAPLRIAHGAIRRKHSQQLRPRSERCRTIATTRKTAPGKRAA